jgi:GntR family transcriptional regulator / MocR family aminotransferase
VPTLCRVDLYIGLEGRRDLSGQIYRQIRSAILDGRLPAGAGVPSTRELAAGLAVSRNTVSVAYDRLAGEGFLTGRAGVGTYVSAQIRAPERARSQPVGTPPRPTQIWDSQSDPIDLSSTEPEFDFRTGMPDARKFPYPTWRALVAGQLRESVRLGAYGDPAGHPGLRAAIARHVGVSRGVRASVDEVLVTNGTQQALDLLCRVLLEPGDQVAMEDPGYPPARRLFVTLRAAVLGVPVDAEGVVVEALPARVRLAYVTPSHQFPLGMPMSLPRRLALLAWAERTGAVIVEDDYDSEYRYTGRPIEPLHSLDRTGRVLYVGSFSKTMLPTLRLGFLIAPRPLCRALRTAKYVLDWHTALPMQGALAEFIDRGLLAKHVRRMRAVYQTRRNQVLSALEQDFAEQLDVISTVAGLHVAARLRAGAAPDAVELTARARTLGVECTPLSRYAVSASGPDGVLLGYGAIPTERIAEGLRRLRTCFDGVPAQTGTSRDGP